MKRLALVLSALVFAGALLIYNLSAGVETSVTSLVGGSDVLSALAEKTSNIVRVHCVDSNRIAACRAVFNFDPPLDPTAFLETLRTHGKGLLTAKDRARLEKGDLARIRRSVMRRDYSSVGLFAKADDPYYFLNDFTLALKSLRPAGLADGAEILTGTVRGKEDEEGLRKLLALAEKDEGINLSGAAFHTLLATEKTKREINLLGTLSCLVVFLCGWCLFRNFRFALPTLFALGGGFIVACAAVGCLSGRPHAMTFLFGTTLIGLGVDYCYHTLAGGREKGFVPKLTQALATTCLAFSPLLVSSVSVLREMSVFTITGLVTIYLLALFTLRGQSPHIPRGQTPRVPALQWLSLLLLALAAWRGGLSFDSDPTQFHKPEPVMARGEAKLSDVMGDTVSQLVLVPLVQWQEENAALKAKMGTVPSTFLTPADLPLWMTLSLNGIDYIMLPKSVAGEGYQPVDLKGALADLFAALARETYVLLAISFGVFLVATLLVFRRRFIQLVTPVACAVVCTFATLAILGEAINFFQLLTFFILVGLGIDYSIFQRSDPTPISRRVVFFSFLTSLAGFGFLAFTSFPVTHSMGLTLAIGLFFAYVFSLSNGDSPHKNQGDCPHWAAQKEQSAGKFRIHLMWWFYRFLGKDIAKILFFPAFLFIYPFCRPARAALKQYYEVTGVCPRPFQQILSFAWSMIDKTDACTLCKNPPTFTLTGDTDWTKGGAFLLSTHLGCIEVLPALRKQKGTVPLKMTGTVPTPKVHAFQQMGHNAIFTSLFAKHLNPDQLTLHAVEDIGVETAVEMKAAIDRGELVLMAGDRLSAGTVPTAKEGRTSARQFSHPFFGRPCAWPKGVFTFAKLMDSPIYAIVCVKTGWNAYEVSAKRLGTVPLAEYVAFLEDEVKKQPYQWYQFYPFFSNDITK